MVDTVKPTDLPRLPSRHRLFFNIPSSYIGVCSPKIYLLYRSEVILGQQIFICFYQITIYLKASSLLRQFTIMVNQNTSFDPGLPKQMRKKCILFASRAILFHAMALRIFLAPLI